ncbi:alpha/beta hydrolase [Patescibacteria group bacterium]|nr:alpha/beta hydrolase [Patescibacteria group bacterium]
MRVIKHDQRRLASTITQPSLLVWGEQDGVTPLIHALALRDKLSDSRLEVVAGANHRLPYQKPTKFAKIVKEFIR